MFDLLVLEFLLRRAQPGHVVLGSDYPFPIGDLNLAEVVRRSRLSDEQRGSVLLGTAGSVFGVSPVGTPEGVPASTSASSRGVPSEACRLRPGAAAEIDEALAELSVDPEESKVLADGQSPVPLLSFRLARPARLIDLARIDGLRGITRNDGRLSIGAMTTQHEAERSDLVCRCVGERERQGYQAGGQKGSCHGDRCP